MKRYLLITVLALLFSCEIDQTNTIAEEKAIKTITTKFISHQSDTQEKDQRTIAVASFLPDGTLDQLTQHMTYPYTYADPKPVNVWGKASPESIGVIMDGMDLDVAANHLAYGADWPLKYVAIASKAHPKFQTIESELDADLQLNEAGFPKHIKLEGKRQFGPNAYHEDFDYHPQGLVKHYTHYVEMDYSNYPEEFKEIRNLSSDIAKVNHVSYDFHYTNNDLINLVKHFEGKTHQYTFDYNQKDVVESAFLIDGKQYHHRKYFYSESGLRDRTEIYNSLGELEYEIFYTYEYY